MKPILVASVMIMSAHGVAYSGNSNTGTIMTSGPTSSSYSMSTRTTNPAINSLLIAKDESLRMAYFPTFGGNLEIGPVDNFADDLEELADIIDDPSLAADDASAVLERFNKVLVSAGEDGYLKFNAGASAPLLPLYFHSDLLGGTIGIEYSVDAQAGLRLLDAPLSYNNQNESFTTASSFYIKSGVEQSFGLSYSRPIFTYDFGQLIAGAKINYITMQLSKQVLPIIELAGLDIGDLVKDEYDNNQVSTADIGVDIGLVWDAKGYRIGLSGQNINQPEFAYGEIGTKCSDIQDNSPSRTNCEVARYFSQTLGRISTNEIHIKQALWRADALIKVSDGFAVSGAVDLVKHNDMVGDDHQWVHVAGEYQSGWFVLPSLRVGYHKNLIGSETSSLSAGFTLFKAVSVDIEYGLQSVVVDGTSAPRRLGFSLSIQETF